MIDADGTGIVDISTCIRRQNRVSCIKTQIHTHANQALRYIEICY